ncbi:GNAT family N-acetyltransferase [Microbacterium sp. VKM Ac-2923]|uniref:GNAT family N-acetyltransferase n=1 Tax=Microbacterium sp. VKM Ac-2923 TaxID=2929476 RepID=UPI001FB3BFA8|nr:GNAT family N-acetyltransferase [Microbacterium sp. VKM Ac-2923]MCJ1709548.1 GNAT family N-acetyltransferase [Microbacterium sp. VKM Ac-2923]
MGTKTPELSLRRFTAQDWTWLQGWSEDNILKTALGPLDEEWLYAALHTADGSQLVASDGDGPVGLFGVVWDPDGRRHVVTGLAVHPARRRSGLGLRVLSVATRWAEHPPSRGWAAFVDPGNHSATAFFRAAGWRNEGLDDGMRRYTCKKVSF